MGVLCLIQLHATSNVTNLLHRKKKITPGKFDWVLKSNILTFSAVTNWIVGNNILLWEASIYDPWFIKNLHTHINEASVPPIDTSRTSKLFLRPITLDQQIGSHRATIDLNSVLLKWPFFLHGASLVAVCRRDIGHCNKESRILLGNYSIQVIVWNGRNVYF